MCLFVDRKQTKHFSKIKKGTYIFYKTFNVLNSEILCLRSPVTATELPINFTKSIKAKGYLDIVKNLNDASISDEKISIINGGAVHAYVKYKTPRKFQITIPIQVESDDIIAFGIMDDVCFFKYKITEETWKKIKLKFEKRKQYYDKTY
jgi:hypothetical protein